MASPSPAFASHPYGISVAFRDPGGASANVSIAISRLGGLSAFIGKLGDEDFSSMLAAVLWDNGVSVAGILFSPSWHTLLISLRANGAHELMFFPITIENFHSYPLNVVLDIRFDVELFWPCDFCDYYCFSMLVSP
ncbi:fructokinase-1-like [Dendrobium catenatum]|uniref:fructokinase-1-like n=1 Tax=Dendrobium catenatum TaxID=906689 RepID=UPI00109FF43F|nr:fructokinase-1-like [Dendrobium catenatum]